MEVHLYGCPEGVTQPVFKEQPDILLVEDNPADVRLFKEALAAHGTPVLLTVATSGEEAMRRLRRDPPYEHERHPSIVVLDLNLPMMDGRDVLMALKGDPLLRQIPVVVFTTSGSQADINGAYDLHANCYIRKPADLEEFMEAISSCETFWLNVARLPRM